MRFLLTLIAFLPAVVTGVLVQAHVENVPAWDDFERAALLERAAEGELSFSDLYAPHIDHRILFPRLFILANAALSGANLIWENALIFALVMVTSAGLAGLLRRTSPESSPAALGAAFLGINLLVFSPLQWENFLWAIQTAFVLPMACLALALWALESGLAARWRFVLALAAAVVGSHSFSHGMLIWLAVPAWVVLRAPWVKESQDRRARFLLAWGIAAAVFLVPYFTLDYKASSSHASHQYGATVGGSTPAVANLRESLASPRVIAHFYFSMVGSPLSRSGSRAPADVAVYWGLFVHLLLGVALAAVAVARDDELWRKSVPWWVLAGTALVACALAALGRAIATSGIYALAPRYVSVSQFVLVALVGLGALLASRGGRMRWVVLGLGVALLFPVAAGWRFGLTGLDSWQTARLQARTSILYIEAFKPRFIRRIDIDWETARGSATVLDRLGYLDPPLAHDRRTDAFETAPRDADGVSGRITGVHVAGTHLVVRGEAALAGGRTAHGVLLTVREDGERRAVGIGEGRARPPGPLYLHDHLFGEVEFDPDEPTGVWRSKVDLSRLPDDPEVYVDAFVVDSGRMRLYPLAQRIRVSEARSDPRVRLIRGSGSG